MIYSTLLTLIVNNPLLDSFARAGGGGSSSGGGGGDGDSVIILLGYLPMHFLGSLLRKKTSMFIANLLGWFLAIIFASFWLFFGSIGFIIAGAALVGMGAGLYNWFNKIAKLAGKAKEKQKLAVVKDSAWDMVKLKTQVSDTFNHFQTDWSNNNSDAMQSYLTRDYLYHNKLIILALQQLGRRNVVGHPKIIDLELVDVVDSEVNTNDRFVMYIKASSSDKLYDTKTNTLIFKDENSFEEYWKFVRTDNSRWILEGITQVTEDPYMRNNVIADFAKSHNYCYSADWGWLLLPNRGQLFSAGEFGKSDINNHVIGIYNNTLIQIYNYIPTPASSGTVCNYVIAQVALPKMYGNIVVRKKRILSLFGIKGLKRVTLEWGEFNKRYEVWASDMERVTSFELLNPSFMVKLQELPFEVNIEVVDNIVYLYSANTKASAQTYETMLAILYQSFKEMRM